MKPKFPLMRHNIIRADLDAVIEHLKQDDPILTNGPQCAAFEAEWSKWLGVKHSVFVNSGASANLIAMALLKIRHPEGGEVIVPPLTWVSDIASVLQNGFTPVFADIDRRTLAMAPQEILARITPRTRAVFLTHVQGFDGLTDGLLKVAWCAPTTRRRTSRSACCARTAWCARSTMPMCAASGSARTRR
jgi:CDP-6-deoxy-D-xylo-4-hexulose-3-dehydrase